MEDADVPILLRSLTDIEEGDIDQIVKEHEKNPEMRKAQNVLAGN